MAGSRAALRVGLIGGLVLSIAVAAQQVTDSPDLQCFGYLITIFGLGIVGYMAARDVGDFDRLPSLRAGAIGGLIAGLLRCCWFSQSLATICNALWLLFARCRLRCSNNTHRWGYHWMRSRSWLS